MINKPVQTYLLVFVFCFSSIGAQTALKFLSYNIEGMKPGTNYPARLQAIIQELKILDPDVMGLQEVAQHHASDNMAQTIADSLSVHFGSEYHVYWQFTHTAYSSYSEGLAIVSKWPIETTGFQNLPVAVFPRKVLWNKVIINDSPVHFFTTHLAYRQEDNATRIQQVNAIMAFINSKYYAAPAPVVLTGDFNCEPDSDPIELFTNYTSTWNADNPGQPGFTHTSNYPTRKIDYVFVRNDIQLEVLQSSLAFYTAYNGTHYPSDHLGLMTTFSQQPLLIDTIGHNSENFKLKTFPNPFNSSLTMSVRLAATSNLSLEIFSLGGQRRYSESSRNLTAGEHSFIWRPGPEEGSAIFLCCIRTDRGTSVQKILLVR